MTNYITLTIIDSYAKTLEEAKLKLNHALMDGDIPQALRHDLCKKAYDATFGFVDSVINARKYTVNDDLIAEIQERFMEEAVSLHDRAFEALYQQNQLWGMHNEIAVTKED
jgi:hypothetical protein